MAFRPAAWRAGLCAAASLGALAACAPAVGVTLVPVASGFGTPTDITAPPGGAKGRVFVATQDGKIWIVSGTTRRRQAFLDISGQISSGGERGLLGLAFHPAYATNGRFFVNYTDPRGNTRIAEFRRSAGNVNLANPRGTVLLTIAQPFANHNGGDLAFGPDGKLYVATGDGGSGGDPQRHGQRLNTFLGKILRLDVSSPGRVKVPADNPFVARPGARRLIWHYGLRNPWRISFDRATGDMWIGDVGQNAWEEIDRAPAGRGGLNFGWNSREGRVAFPGGAPLNGPATEPVVVYERAKGCSVTGGFVYRGPAIRDLSGRYVFSDFCSGRIFTVGANGAGFRELAVGRKLEGATTFGEDSAGQLYAGGSGGVFRFSP